MFGQSERVAGLCQVLVSDLQIGALRMLVASVTHEKMIADVRIQRVVPDEFECN